MVSTGTCLTSSTEVVLAGHLGQTGGSLRGQATRLLAATYRHHGCYSITWSKPSKSETAAGNEKRAFVAMLSAALLL